MWMNPKQIESNPTDLLKCPFCGSSASVWSDNERQWIECDQCESRTSQYRMTRKAKEAWNQRK